MVCSQSARNIFSSKVDSHARAIRCASVNLTVLKDPLVKTRASFPSIKFNSWPRDSVKVFAKPAISVVPSSEYYLPEHLSLKQAVSMPSKMAYLPSKTNPLMTASNAISWMSPTDSILLSFKPLCSHIFIRFSGFSKPCWTLTLAYSDTWLFSKLIPLGESLCI